MAKTYTDKEFIEHMRLFNKCRLPDLKITPISEDMGHAFSIDGSHGLTCVLGIPSGNTIPADMMDELIELLRANNSFIQKWSYFYRECKECQKRKKP